jgi:hypothetical protein
MKRQVTEDRPAEVRGALQEILSQVLRHAREARAFDGIFERKNAVARGH